MGIMQARAAMGDIKTGCTLGIRVPGTTGFVTSRGWALSSSKAGMVCVSILMLGV
jgi:hypothetical protein